MSCLAMYRVTLKRLPRLLDLAGHLIAKSLLQQSQSRNSVCISSRPTGTYIGLC